MGQLVPIAPIAANHRLACAVLSYGDRLIFSFIASSLDDGALQALRDDVAVTLGQLGADPRQAVAAVTAASSL